MHRLVLLIVCILMLLLALPLCGAQQIQGVALGHPLLRGLVGWWRALPGLTGGDRWFDLSGHGLHGTLTNMGYSPTSGWSPSMRRGGLAHLGCDGTDDYVTVAKDASLNLSAGTIAIWVLRTATSANNEVVSMGDGPGNAADYFLIGWLSGGSTLRLEVVAAATTLWSATLTVSANAWHHLVLTVDSSGNAVYVDGVAQTVTYGTGSAASTAFLTAVYANVLSLDICRLNTVLYPEYHTGAVDDLRLWSRALSPLEVQTVYQQSLLGDPDLLVPPRLPVAAVPSVAGTPGAFFPFFR